MNSIVNNAAANRFESQHDGQTAVAEYRLADKVMTVTHIIVPSALRGQGIATNLARAIVEHARAQQLSIVPQCPFMTAYFQRNPEAADVWDASEAV